MPTPSAPALRDAEAQIEAFNAIDQRRVRFSEVLSLYEALNALYFNGELLPCVDMRSQRWAEQHAGMAARARDPSTKGVDCIGLARPSRRITRACGHLSKRMLRDRRRMGIKVVEASIHLADEMLNMPEEAAGTLLHEMIHVWQMQEAVRTQSPLPLDQRFGGHGPYFVDKMNAFNQRISPRTGKPLVHVTIKADMSKVRTSKRIPDKHCVVVRIDNTKLARVPFQTMVYECPVDPRQFSERHRSAFINALLDDIKNHNIDRKHVEGIWHVAFPATSSYSFVRLRKSDLRMPAGHRRLKGFSDARIRNRELFRLLGLDNESGVHLLYREGDIVPKSASSPRPVPTLAPAPQPLSAEDMQATSPGASNDGARLPKPGHRSSAEPRGQLTMFGEAASSPKPRSLRPRRYAARVSSTQGSLDL